MLRACLGDAADRSHLVCTPLYHSGPLTYADGASLLGADLVLLDRFDPEEVLATIEALAVTSTFMVPTQFVRLLRLPPEVRSRYDLSILRMVVHGSAPVAPDIKRAMIEWLGSGALRVLRRHRGRWRQHRFADVAGRIPARSASPAMASVWSSATTSGAVVAPRVEGQVWFHDGRAFDYKDDPDKTAGAVRDGWFTLGDIGYLDDDGFLFLCDRRADVIISGGVNVYPAQIEAVLLAHPRRRRLLCRRRARRRVGRVACAPSSSRRRPPFVARTSSRPCSLTAGPSSPATRCREAVDFDDSLPRTETGKLARRTVRDRYWAGRERRI